MIDIHCHILPNIDDGPVTMEDSVTMCRIAEEDGITTIVATPHFRFGDGDRKLATVRETVELLRQELAARDIGVRILIGADISVTPELHVYLPQHAELTLNGTGKYFLAELPHDAIPKQWDLFLLGLKSRGVTPILTHPERNPWFIARPESLYSYVLGGGLVQITAQSVAGDLGTSVRDCSHYLLRNGLAHMMASDAHSLQQRPPILSRAVRIASDVIGDAAASTLVMDVPLAIIQGNPVEVNEPASPFATRQKKWYQRILDL